MAKAHIEVRPLGSKTYYFQQFDLLKAAAIIFVILGHAFSFQNAPVISTGTISPADTPSILTALNSLKITSIFTHWPTYSALITQQAVPVFIALMTFNFASSYKRRFYNSLKDIYSKKEYSRRIPRFLIPFAIVYILALLLGGCCQSAKWDTF